MPCDSHLSDVPSILDPTLTQSSSGYNPSLLLQAPVHHKQRSIINSVHGQQMELHGVPEYKGYMVSMVSDEGDKCVVVTHGTAGRGVSLVVNKSHLHPLHLRSDTNRRAIREDTPFDLSEGPHVTSLDDFFGSFGQVPFDLEPPPWNPLGILYIL